MPYGQQLGPGSPVQGGWIQWKAIAITLIVVIAAGFILQVYAIEGARTSTVGVVTVERQAPLEVPARPVPVHIQRADPGGASVCELAAGRLVCPAEKP